MRQKFGICEWSLPVSGPTAIILAAKAGYEGMQLGEAGGRIAGYPLCNKQIADIYMETADKADIKLHSLNLGALLSEGTLNCGPHTFRGEYARESIENGIKACHMMNMGAVVITAEPKDEEAMANVIAHLRYASDVAEAMDIRVSVESAVPVDGILKILEGTGGRIKLCMDILNPLRFGTGDPMQQIDIFGRERIDHFHIKDTAAELFRPGERGCVPLGQGDGRYKESVKKIKEIGYEGWMISENYYHMPPMTGFGKDSISLAAADLDTLRSSFGG